mgnify:CR=1 FL=1
MRLTVNRELMLRPIALQDATAVLELILKNEQHLKQWLPWVVKPFTIHTVLSYIEMSDRKRLQQTGYEYVILYRNSICGIVGLEHVDWQNRKASIGYWIGKEYEGKGLVLRAVNAVVKAAFEDLKLNRLEMYCAEQNFRSRAVPERLFFRIEGILRQNEWLYDHYVDHVLYGQLRSEYDHRPKQLSPQNEA